MCPMKQVTGPAASFARGVLRRERRAEREASRWSWCTVNGTTPSAHAGLLQPFLLGCLSAGVHGLRGETRALGFSGDCCLGTSTPTLAEAVAKDSAMGLCWLGASHGQALLWPPFPSPWHSQGSSTATLHSSCQEPDRDDEP